MASDKDNTEMKRVTLFCNTG